MSLISLSQVRQQYKNCGTIGKGSYGEVSRIVHKQTKKQYALKKIIIHEQYMCGIAINEILSHVTLKHQRVVKLQKFYVQGKSDIEVGLIMELGTCSLQKLIKYRYTHGKRYFTQKQLQSFAWEFIPLFSYIQSQNKYHGDVKPANIIVFDKTNLQCKITDFGFCRDVSYKISNEQPLGSFSYMSPLLKERFNNPHKYNGSNKTKDDVYSFGMTLYQMANLGFHNFKSCNFNQLRERYNNAKIIDIIELMMEKDQNKRPSFVELIQKYKNIDQNRSIKPVTLHDGIPQQLEQEIVGMKMDNLRLQSQPSTIHQGETWLPIHSMCIYEDIIFVGTEKGEVKALHNQRIFVLPSSHTRSVEVLEIIDGKIWSAGCDSKIFIWDCKLIKEEIDKNKSVTMSQISLFNQQRTVERNIIQNDKVRREKKDIPFHKEGISCLLCITNNLLAIGYYKGELYVSFNGKQKQVYAHDGLISSIKQKDNMLYSSGADGMLKCFNLKDMQLESKFFRTTSPIIGFKFVNQWISIICMAGIVEVISYDLLRILEGKRISKSCIYSCYFNGSYNLILNEQGEILDNQRKITRIDCRGPNCIRMIGNVIVATSFKGHVFRISP